MTSSGIQHQFKAIAFRLTSEILNKILNLDDYLGYLVFWGIVVKNGRPISDDVIEVTVEQLWPLGGL